MSSFHSELLQEIVARSGANDNFHHSEFVGYACEILEDEGAVPDFELCDFRKQFKGLAVDAYSLDREMGELVLIVAEFHADLEPYTINRSSMEQLIKRPERFFFECLR